jgi:Ca2+-binding RTX toxin-like protein
MEMTMIARSGARVPGTTLVTESPDFGEPVMVDIAGIEPVYGGSIGPVTSTPQAPNEIFDTEPTPGGGRPVSVPGTTPVTETADFGEPMIGIAGIDPVYGDSIGPVTSTPHAPSIYGTNGSDDMFGTSADDVIKGLDGNDWLYGLAGNDILDGGRGADVMAGGTGDDTYHVSYAGPTANTGDVIWEWGGEGTDTVLLESPGFFLLPTAVENLVFAGSATQGAGNALDNVIIGNAADNYIVAFGGNDTIDGGYGNDTINGDNYDRYSGGNDSIEGGYGNDLLHGDGGNDNLSGGVGNDSLDGGGGQDTLTGGSGGDSFVWHSTYDTTLAGQAADIVTDFNRADGDLLDFHYIDANATGGTVDDAFTFVGVVDVTQGGSFTAPGQIGYFTTPTDTFILLNTEVDAGIDYQDATIRVAGVHNVDASWFVL